MEKFLCKTKKVIAICLFLSLLISVYSIFTNDSYAATKSCSNDLTVKNGHSNVMLRESYSSSSKKVGVLNAGDKLVATKQNGNWYYGKVSGGSANGKSGWVYYDSSYITLTARATKNTDSSTTSTTTTAPFASKMLKMAKAMAEQKIKKGANPITVKIDGKNITYKIGRGMDCTGAVQVCAQYAGAKYNITIVSAIRNDKTYTQKISKDEAGALIIYDGHVGISDGKGGVYHTSSSKGRFYYESNAKKVGTILEYRRVIK